MSDKVYGIIYAGTGSRDIGWRACLVLSYDNMKSYGSFSNKQKWRPFLLWARLTAKHWAWRENRKRDRFWIKYNQANQVNQRVGG